MLARKVKLCPLDREMGYTYFMAVEGQQWHWDLGIEERTLIIFIFQNWILQLFTQAMPDIALPNYCKHLELNWLLGQSNRLMLGDTTDYSPPGSSVHRILQARVLEWVAISSSRGSSRPRDQTCVSCISCTGRQILYHCATWETPPSCTQTKNW